MKRTSRMGSNPKAISLLSGGLDSTVSLANWQQFRSEGQVVLALTMNYGQRAAKQEIAASAAIAKHYGIPHHVVELPWFHHMLPIDLGPLEKAAARETGQTGVARVWVPNRNGILLNIAAGFAEAYGATEVLFGSNLEEAEVGFPDNTQAYRNALNHALTFSTANQVRVVAPVELLTKDEIIGLALRLNVPLHLIWSCYEGSRTHCGVCPSCQLLKKALLQNHAQNQIAFASM